MIQFCLIFLYYAIWYSIQFIFLNCNVSHCTWCIRVIFFINNWNWPMSLKQHFIQFTIFTLPGRCRNIPLLFYRVFIFNHKPLYCTGCRLFFMLYIFWDKHKQWNVAQLSFLKCCCLFLTLFSFPFLLSVPPLSICRNVLRKIRHI